VGSKPFSRSGHCYTESCCLFLQPSAPVRNWCQLWKLYSCGSISKQALQFSRTFLWSLHMLHANYSTVCNLNVFPLNLVFPLS